MGRIRYWLALHPRIGRPLQVVAGVEVLALAAVTLAPQAAASTNAAALNWTGLHDTDNVPIGDHFLSLAGLPERITQGGPQGSGWNPSTWGPWMLHGMKALLDTLTAANILTGEASFVVGFIAVALWLMKLTVSNYWVTVFGQIAAAVTTAVIEVTTRWGLVALTVPIGVFLGVMAHRRGEHGRGYSMILLALVMPTLAVTVFSDPAGMMYGPHGLLMFARSVGFSSAQAVTHHGAALSGGGFTGQVDTLTSSLVTHVVREPLELFNFGHVIDGVGGCGPAYSQALRDGVSDGPVQAMKTCGDIEALRYAEDLDGSNVFIGAALMVAAALFGWFMVSSGASVFMVSLKAMYTTAKLLPSLFAGGVSGNAQQHAKTTVWQFFKHPLEAMVYILFVSVMGLGIERLVSQPLPAELGGSSPFAHVVVMAAASMAALHLLRHIRADLAGHPPQRGMLARAGYVALGLGMHAALGGAGSAALGWMKGLRNKFGGETPWERQDKLDQVPPAEVLGEPLEGFDPIPGDDGTEAVSTSGSATSSPTDVPALNQPNPQDLGLNPLSTAQRDKAGQRSTKAPRKSATQSAEPLTAAGDLDNDVWNNPAEVEPLAEADLANRQGSAQSRRGASTSAGYLAGDVPPVESYIHHSEDVPLPPEPPVDTGESTSVDAIPAD